MGVSEVGSNSAGSDDALLADQFNFKAASRTSAETDDWGDSLVSADDATAGDAVEHGRITMASQRSWISRPQNSG